MSIDISMPADLRRRRRSNGYAAICVIADAGAPGDFLLAQRTDVEGHLRYLRHVTGRVGLSYAHLVWTPGSTVARSVLADAEARLSNLGYALGRHWFRADLALIDDIVRTGLRSLRSRSWTQAELIDLLRRQSDAEADRFAGGII